ncbi:uncharacterized protein UDID_17477 [Ustilago sp. UG-2017a]|nr:uncharacterized protein UDID_17477 [Ustilago sp. UG-2017a]
MYRQPGMHTAIDLCTLVRWQDMGVSLLQVSTNRCGHSVQRWLGTINIDTKVMMTPRSGVSVDDDEADGVVAKVGGVGVIPRPQWTTAFGSIYIRTADLLWVTFGHQFICVASGTAPALSPESTLLVEYCTGGPSSTTPVLLSCVDPFDTAPPPQDLLAGFLYTAPSL